MNHSPSIATNLCSGYRFGFNGKENETEWTGQNGSTYDFGARLYDARIGRWMACDPKFAKYPDQSSYSFAANCPITFIDPQGDTIKWAAGTERFQQMTIDKRCSSEIFDKLITNLENSCNVYYVFDGDSWMQGHVQKQEGVGTKAAGTYRNNLVFFSGSNVDEQAIIEEFFHAFQIGEFYGNSRTVPEIEAEAELFVAFVQMQVKLEVTGVDVMETNATSGKITTISGGSTDNLLNAMANSIAGGGQIGLVMLSEQLTDDKTLEIKSEAAKELYFKHLESFKGANVGSAGYGGNQRTLTPDAHNEIVR